MKKLIKLLFLILLLLTIGVGVFINKTLEKETNEDLPFFQSIKMALIQNFEGNTEKTLKGNRLKEKYQNIVIYYPNDFSELIPITKETLEWAITKNEEVFVTITTQPVDLIVFKDKEEMKQISDLVDVSGFYSNFDKLLGITYEDKELILNRKETPLYFFQKSILHEYTHYIFQRTIESSLKNTSTAYPVWFQEGISEYVGNDKTIVEYSNFQVVPFNQLSDGDQWQEARFQNGTNVYDQSYFAIKYLIDKYGEETISNIIKSINRTGDFEGSFIETTGINVLEFEDNFLNAYK
ncbi:MAG: collagenase [Bacillus sp. (in: Bacteria)]|nr:collagenase [Bacillus sp. (in: firmicutes)]